MARPHVAGFDLIEPVGNGAGSVIYKAVERSTGRDVAIKHVTRTSIDLIAAARHEGSRQAIRLAQEADYKSFFDQVLNEFAVLREVNNATTHPNVVQVLQLIKVRKALLFREGYNLVMEYVTGQSLRENRELAMPDLILRPSMLWGG